MTLFQPRDRIFVKSYVFLSFATSMGKNKGKNIIKNVNGKYSQKFIDHAKQPATNWLKIVSKRAIQKIGFQLTGNKTADEIIKVSTNSNTWRREYGTRKRNTKRKIIPSEKRKKIIEDLRLI